MIFIESIEHIYFVSEVKCGVAQKVGTHTVISFTAGLMEAELRIPYDKGLSSEGAIQVIKEYLKEI